MSGRASSRWYASCSASAKRLIRKPRPKSRFDDAMVLEDHGDRTALCGVAHDYRAHRVAASPFEPVADRDFGSQYNWRPATNGDRETGHNGRAAATGV